MSERLDAAWEALRFDIDRERERCYDHAKPVEDGETLVDRHRPLIEAEARADALERIETTCQQLVDVEGARWYRAHEVRAIERQP